MFELLDFNENPNVGVYCRANESLAFVQKGLSKHIKKKIASTLDVKIVELAIVDSTIVGSLLALNSSGAVLTNLTDKQTIDLIQQQGHTVFTFDDPINAAGNDILTNDRGALIHPDIKEKSRKQLTRVYFLLEMLLDR